MENATELPALVGAVADLHRKQSQARAEVDAMPARERLLRIHEVEALCSIKKSTIYALMAQIGADGRRKFPACVMLSGGRAVAWKASSISAWIESRPEAVIGAKVANT